MSSNLENTFENAYKEYKDYSEFVKNGEEDEELKRAKDNFNKEAPKMEMSEKIQKLYELNVEPRMNQHDLTVLTHNLKVVYETVKADIKIPEEIRKEVEDLPKPHMYYTIKDNKKIMIDEELHNSVKENYFAELKWAENQE